MQTLYLGNKHYLALKKECRSATSLREMNLDPDYFELFDQLFGTPDIYDIEHNQNMTPAL
jgi:hypothetical protein